MSRSVSINAMKSALAQETDAVFCTLLEITHPSLSAPILLCNNTEDIASNLATGSTATFLAFPFSLDLPTDEAEQEPQIKLSIPNIDRRLIADVRSITGGPTIRLWLVLAGPVAIATPNVAEYGPVKMKASSVSYTAEVLQFVLGVDNYMGEPIPWLTFSPEYFPSMFN